MHKPDEGRERTRRKRGDNSNKDSDNGPHGNNVNNDNT